MLVSLSNQRFDFIFLNILKVQTSILPSFPKTLISRCCVECMKLSYLSQPCIPCQLPLLSHGEQQRIMESHLNGSCMIFIIMWHSGDINPFHNNYHAITFPFGNELYIVSSLLFCNMRLIFDVVYYFEKLCKCEIDSRRYLQYQKNFQDQKSNCKSKIILSIIIKNNLNYACISM